MEEVVRMSLVLRKELLEVLTDGVQQKRIKMAITWDLETGTNATQAAPRKITQTQYGPT